jgi:G2/mitotic-specific cyclin 3/4
LFANDTVSYDLTEPTALNVANIINDSVSNPDALFPVWDKKTKQELRSVYSEFKNKPGILDEDDEDTFDVSMVAEYGQDIFQYMRKLEIQMRPNPGYMDAQTEIHWSMRSILIDWLVQVHHRFNLLPETLYLTINYIDRFLSIKTVSLSKFQLVGATALFLAAKYEEINCPSVQELEYMVDHGYSVDEILKAERYMIDLLEFNLGWPGPMSFLRRTSKADDYDLETRTLAKYLLEVTVMDEKFVAAPPSWTAAAAHCLARRMLGRGAWSRAHVYFSGYTQVQLQPCVEAILECCKDPLQHHKAIYEKYADRKYKKASIFVQDYISRNED